MKRKILKFIAFFTVFFRMIDPLRELRLAMIEYKKQELVFLKQKISELEQKREESKKRTAEAKLALENFEHNLNIG